MKGKDQLPEQWRALCRINYRKMLYIHPLFPYTLVHPIHWEERRGDKRESVLVQGPCGYVSDFCVVSKDVLSPKDVYVS